MPSGKRAGIETTPSLYMISHANGDSIGNFDYRRWVISSGSFVPIAATTRCPKFGLALTDLLERFRMPDAKVIDEHYKTNPRADGREHWAGVVSHYRTDVIHYGYLDLDVGGHDWRDVWTIVNHLHDITARIILRALGYDGEYQPTVVPQPSVPFALDWVQPNTMAGTLGYQ